MTFNILQFYNDYSVPFFLSGKNVMKGFVNICCPFCRDTSNHLGVSITNPQSLQCWKCGKHSLSELLSCFSDKDFKTLYRIYNTIDDKEEIFSAAQKEKPVLSSKEIEDVFLKNSKSIPDNTTIKYLHNRNFDYYEIEQHWKIRAGIEMGEYRYYLMIPIFSDNKIVSFQGRDITGRQDNKYRTCSGTNIKNYLYGLDYIQKDKVIICEGVTDVWRLGKGNAVATFGIEYSRKQIELLIKNQFKYVVIFFDYEKQAQEKAKKLIADLEIFDIKCTNFMIDKKDPADLSKKEADKVIYSLLSF